MSGWQGSDRKERLPADWPKLVRQVKNRDGWQCTKRLPSGKRCPRGRATGHRLQVDHKVRGDDHSLKNLRSLCEEHHGQKSSQEGNDAQRLPPTTKRTDPHPGEAL